jgi:hypothetical protein
MQIIPDKAPGELPGAAERLSVSQAGQNFLGGHVGNRVLDALNVKAGARVSACVDADNVVVLSQFFGYFALPHGRGVHFAFGALIAFVLNIEAVNLAVSGGIKPLFYNILVNLSGGLAGRNANGNNGFSGGKHGRGWLKVKRIG